MEKNLLTRQVLALSASAILLAAASGRAAVVITEVDPSGSSSTSNTYNADWFELTNTGATAVDITGWKMDDNSHDITKAVALRGVTSLAAGQSVVFAEGLADGSTDSTIDGNFKNFWFGSNVPAGFVMGNYGGTGVGLSQTADEVNIYDSTGAEVVGVGFGTTGLGVSLDDLAGVGSATQPDPIISTNSVVGVNGAFASFGTGTGTSAGINEVGSPGIAVAAPEPASLLMLGMGAGLLSFRRSAKKA
ncbi:MAG TPA: lamin tail domain-containing protein [Phycisphaerae bacterium]|nr:lamin tail domain-containing protein [Phycisphaerae bacterium]